MYSVRFYAWGASRIRALGWGHMGGNGVGEQQGRYDMWITRADLAFAEHFISDIQISAECNC